MSTKTVAIDATSRGEIAARDADSSVIVSKHRTDAGYTEAQARAYVAAHSDDDEHDEGTLERVFAALAGRTADDADRAEGLWSHCVQLT